MRWAQSERLVMFVVVATITMTTAAIVYGKRSEPSVTVMLSVEKRGWLINLWISGSLGVLKFSPNCLFLKKLKSVQWKYISLGTRQKMEQERSKNYAWRYPLGLSKSFKVLVLQSGASEIFDANVTLRLRSTEMWQENYQEALRKGLLFCCIQSIICKRTTFLQLNKEKLIHRDWLVYICWAQV